MLNSYAIQMHTKSREESAPNLIVTIYLILVGNMLPMD